MVFRELQRETNPFPSGSNGRQVLPTEARAGPKTTFVTVNAKNMSQIEMYAMNLQDSGDYLI
jgi:hypothetical protein